MSSLKQESGEDYPEAALKHLEDALRLLKVDRGDNAAYLAGYVVECSMKTLIQLEQSHGWGHDLEQLGQRAQELAGLPGARTARYLRFHGTSHPIYDREGSGWSESLRYQAAGSISMSQAQDWVEKAEQVYADVIFSLRLDGMIT